MTDTITIFCLVHGDSAEHAFPIRIAKTFLIGDLKDMIKEKRHNDFHNIDADKLVLWKVNIPTRNKAIFQQLYAHTPSENAMEEVLGGEKLDDPTQDVGDVFSAPPAKRHIHVIVERPAISRRDRGSSSSPADLIIVSSVGTPSKRFDENEEAAGIKAFRLSCAKVEAFRDLDSYTRLRQRVLVRSVMRECNNLPCAGKRKRDDYMNERLFKETET